MLIHLCCLCSKLHPVAGELQLKSSNNTRRAQQLQLAQQASSIAHLQSQLQQEHDDFFFYNELLNGNVGRLLDEVEQLQEQLHVTTWQLVAEQAAAVDKDKQLAAAASMQQQLSSELAAEKAAVAGLQRKLDQA
jgi:dynactin complex subunit